MLGWELPPHNSGGLGVACYHMSKALAVEGAEIDFIVPYQAQHTEIDFMTVHGATPLSPLERYGLGAYDSSMQLDRDLTDVDRSNLKDMRGVQKRYIQFVETFVNDNEIDAIHAHDWLTMEAGMRGLRAISTRLWSSPDNRDPSFGSFMEEPYTRALISTSVPDMMQNTI